jgi:hypothetical protein
MHTNSKPMEEIRHFLDELRSTQSNISQATGEAREKLQREMRELSDSLHSRLKAAQFFRKDSIFVKYLNPQQVEVVLTPHAINTEVLNATWLDFITQCTVCESAEYADAITSVLENQEVLHG